MGGLVMTYLVLIIISFFFAGLLYLIADKRGANKFFWAIMGFFFGPLAIPFVFFAKKVGPTNTV
jgi:predicted membrane protein